MTEHGPMLVWVGLGHRASSCLHRTACFQWRCASSILPSAARPRCTSKRQRLGASEPAARTARQQLRAHEFAVRNARGACGVAPRTLRIATGDRLCRCRQQRGRPGGESRLFPHAAKRLRWERAVAQHTDADRVGPQGTWERCVLRVEAEVRRRDAFLLNLFFPMLLVPLEGLVQSLAPEPMLIVFLERVRNRHVRLLHEPT
mmetsp:Transcript_9805/g.25753  ORF Transcript_9805/g.25753 Transcript_9805/m.25753 type:complete len:202 (+) Transcript_9805:178-783(+)